MQILKIYFKEAIRLLKKLIRDKKEALGDFDLEVNTSYKLLSSLYLKQNDMPNAALCLKKVNFILKNFQNKKSFDFIVCRN